ncbi:MAG: hypothetical protein HQM02_14140, partial [Magnetococcales bacterium]|nr:hypothetical protein [Magnetococcales bacterium]
MSQRYFQIFRRQLVLALVVGISLLGGCKTVPEGDQEVAKPLVFPDPPDAPRFYYERTLRGRGDAKPKSEDADSMDLRKIVTGEEAGG